MKIDQYVSDNVCKHVELEQFLACFRVAQVCQRQIGFLVPTSSTPWLRTEYAWFIELPYSSQTTEITF